MTSQRFVRFGDRVVLEDQALYMVQELVDDAEGFVRTLETVPGPCLLPITEEELLALRREQEECW